ncbi:MAG: NAD-dependent dehydratase [Saprospirales bacterium]|nr:NAD-dependent dehydratase [Saprospirales bacterium]
MKYAVVFGAGGFIGSHLVRRLKKEGYWVRGVDLKRPEYSLTEADDFIVGDLRSSSVVRQALQGSVDELYQLAADMGGAGYIFSGENDAKVMHNSALINLHTAQACVECEVEKVFYSSSACIYPEHNQRDSMNPKLNEDSAYPAAPDSAYGWEKLFGERVYQAYTKNLGVHIKIGRLHNIYGPQGAWNNGKEKAPAALCRKIAEVEDGGEIEIWGDGLQTRSFLFIDDCLDAIRALMKHEAFCGPVNIGSEQMVTINGLANLIMQHAGKSIKIRHVSGPTGVRGRSSDNALIYACLSWQPKISLHEGIGITYQWINRQVTADSGLQ